MEIDFKEQENIRFDFEDFVEEADKKAFETLDRTLRKGKKFIVCKHWLRGLCKKGDECEFAHIYDHRKMPVCYFCESKYGECNNRECLYRHLDPGKKENQCPWYLRGFCKHGEKCRRPHIRKDPCPNYIAGFCPLGPECKLGHPKFEISPRMESLNQK
ncbi:cleavage and polyadenylation specificity factor subunit 4-related [Anaeramoeba ignava]|uniref:Cleavage and polyadenylation specificity factor subunit 4-related n=1 Tax=Anaeramoeba ignava TaxID=1746090 RepID=A0A9Q0RE20_ANAIG|nr:cleavage and polyadenylation specificity factor subunit 4-related [Anaeramoeba ignava]